MSQGALDRNTFEAIEAYVLDRMDTDERTVFEQRMAMEPALREEVDLERENIRAVELGGVTRMLNEIAQEEGTKSAGLSGSGWGTYLKYAAVIAVIATGAIWWFTRVPLNERLFAEHYAADPGLPVEMGVADDPLFADAMVAFKLGDNSEARSKWSPLLKAEPNNDTLRYYIACSSLGMNVALSAIPLFEGVANDPASAFRDKSKWYLFLAYIKQGELEKAKALSLEDDPAYGERVRAIKAELE